MANFQSWLESKTGGDYSAESLNELHEKIKGARTKEKDTNRLKGLTVLEQTLNFIIARNVYPITPELRALNPHDLV